MWARNMIIPFSEALKVSPFLKWRLFFLFVCLFVLGFFSSYSRCDRPCSTRVTNSKITCQMYVGRITETSTDGNNNNCSAHSHGAPQRAKALLPRGAIGRLLRHLSCDSTQDTARLPWQLCHQLDQDGFQATVTLTFCRVDPIDLRSVIGWFGDNRKRSSSPNFRLDTRAFLPRQMELLSWSLSKRRSRLMRCECHSRFSGKRPDYTFGYQYNIDH